VTKVVVLGWGSVIVGAMIAAPMFGFPVHWEVVFFGCTMQLIGALLYRPSMGA
jgi:hypothetical protein